MRPEGRRQGIYYLLACCKLVILSLPIGAQQDERFVIVCRVYDTPILAFHFDSLLSFVNKAANTMDDRGCLIGNAQGKGAVCAYCHTVSRICSANRAIGGGAIEDVGRTAALWQGCQHLLIDHRPSLFAR